VKRGSKDWGIYQSGMSPSSLHSGRLFIGSCLGQTFGELIRNMIESEKKARLLTDMKKIEETAEFVEI
jgi:hypothetical protein